ncbi:MAG: DUF2062 domain-containing protein [Myxococcota bacterium]
MRKWLLELRARIHQMLRAHLTPASIGKAVAVGVFVGGLPIYGLHIFVCVAVAKWLKLNQALVYAAANVSFPLLAPFLIASQIAVGEWIRHGTFTAGMTLPEGGVWEMATKGGDLFLSCFLGSVVIGVLLGPLLGWMAAAAARRWGHRLARDADERQAAEA